MNVKGVDVPEWAVAAPSYDVFLEEIKGGLLLAQHKLTDGKLLVKLGSDKANVDISYENPSVSRLHAVFAFDDTGSCHCCSLGRHGSRRNREEMPSAKFIKLRSGDQLTFGASQSVGRMFVLNCQPPPDDDEEATNGEEDDDEEIDYKNKFAEDGTSCSDDRPLESVSNNDTGQDGGPQTSCGPNHVGEDGDVCASGGSLRDGDAADEVMVAAEGDEDGESDSHHQKLHKKSKTPILSREEGKKIAQDILAGCSAANRDALVVENFQQRKRRLQQEREKIRKTRESRSAASPETAESGTTSFSGDSSASNVWGMDSQAGEEDRLDQYIDFQSGLINMERLRGDLQLNPRQEKAAQKLEALYGRLNGLHKEMGQLDHQLESAEFSRDASRKESLLQRKIPLERTTEELELEIDSAQQSLIHALGWEAAACRLPSVTRRVKESLEARLFDESDDFFDRTDESRKRGSSSRIENENTLREKLVELRTRIEELNGQISQCPAEGDEPKAEEDLDPLDAYMNQLEKQKRSDLETGRLVLEEEAGEVERLLAIVTDDGRTSHPCGKKHHGNP